MKNEKVYQLTMIWIMRCSRREKSKITVKERYYIIRKEINIKAFRDATRCRWNKHSLHWKLGVILDENHSKKQKIKFHKKYIHH